MVHAVHVDNACCIHANRGNARSSHFSLENFVVGLQVLDDAQEKEEWVLTKIRSLVTRAGKDCYGVSLKTAMVFLLQIDMSKESLRSRSILDY